MSTTNTLLFQPDYDVLNAFSRQGRFTTQTVQRFAAELGISPRIVVGRLQHEKLLPPSHLDALKRYFDFKEAAA